MTFESLLHWIQWPESPEINSEPGRLAGNLTHSRPVRNKHAVATFMHTKQTRQNIPYLLQCCNFKEVGVSWKPVLLNPIRCRHWGAVAGLAASPGFFQGCTLASSVAFYDRYILSLIPRPQKLRRRPQKLRRLPE